MSAVFTPRRVAALGPAIENAVDTLLSQIGQQADFMAAFAFRLPVTVICELLGVPAAGQDRFRPLAADLTEALEATTTASGPSPAATAAAAAELGGYFTALVTERRAAPHDDLISALVAARDSLSDEELLANLIVLLVAGFETTTSLLGNGLALLFEHPETAAALRAGRVVQTESHPGFVSGVGFHTLLPEMWPLCRELIDGALTVSLAEVAGAIRVLAEGNKVIAEGAGAVPVAAALSGRHPYRRVCAVVSGGNLGNEALTTILAGGIP